MPFCSISRKQSSSVFSAVTATSSRVMMSEVFIQAGHLFSAATLSDTSLWEITPVSLPLAFITPTERTCFSRKYCAAWCTLVSSVIEKISLRDPMRSDTFTGPSAGHSGRIVGPTRPYCNMISGWILHPMENRSQGGNSTREPSGRTVQEMYFKPEQLSREIYHTVQSLRRRPYVH